MSYLFLSQAVMMTSLTKVFLALVVLLIWSIWGPVVDKDAMFFNQKRRMWNAINLAAGVIAFAAIFLIPIFVVGWIIALGGIVGAGWAYASVRNKAVADKFKWKLDLDTFNKIVMTRRQARAEKHASFKFKSAKSAPKDLKPVPLHEDDTYEAHLRVEEVLDAALVRHAQSIDITGGESGFNVSLHIDGVDYKHAKFTTEEAIEMIDYLKTHCGLNVEDRRKQQSGSCGIETAAHGNHELKVTTAGSTRGMQCKIAIDATKQVSIEVKDLGLSDQQLEMLKPVLADARGVVVVATPPDQGRSTTLYALVSQHDPYTMDIHVLEQEHERDLEAVTLHQIDPANLNKTLRSMFLRDPNVVAVPTVADQQSAQQIAQAAAEGKRVYAGLRADDTMSALKLWIKAVGDKELVSKSLAAVVSQRLIRKLCTICRQKYKPDVAALRKLNLPADKIKELYKAGGKVVVKNEPEPCPACHGVGYMGRVAAFEVLVIDEEGCKFIETGQLEQLRAHVRRQKNLWLEEAALGKVVAGVTSIGEVMRAMGHEKSGKGA